jgi:hypothetical protein
MTQNYDRLQCFTVLKTAKGADQEKRPEEPKGNFPEAHKEVNYIYGGPDSFESRRKQKLTAREAMAVSPMSHPVFKPKPNTHSMCAQESSLHTYRIENGDRITNVSI